MSLPWVRIGNQPVTVTVAPPVISPSLYISYRGANGREDIAYRYNPSTLEWTTVNDGHIAIDIGGRARFELDGAYVLKLQPDGKVYANKFSERGPTGEASIAFYIKNQTGPKLVAQATASGVLLVPKIAVLASFSGLTDMGYAFQFQIDGALKAAIGLFGLRALAIKEPL